MKTILVFLASSVLLLPMAGAIGRTGNGLADDVDGFTAMVPAGYYIEQSMGDGNLRLMKPPIPLMIGQPPTLELLRIVNVFPQFANMSRMDIALEMGAGNWFQLPTYDPCVNAFGFRNGNVAAGVVIWGQSRGVEIRAQDTTDNWQAINVIVASLKLQPGACDWK